jgi:three-Cys-motif partner protein
LSTAHDISSPSACPFPGQTVYPLSYPLASFWSSSSPFASNVRIFQQDVNKVVNEMCDQLPNQGRVSLNVAFLDPEGLEIHWTTIERLARVQRMDLIINFSTLGLARTIGKKNYDVITRYFGTEQWKQSFSGRWKTSRRPLIDFYLNRLRQFGYQIEINPQIGQEMSFRNSRRAEVYTLIFASKHPLGSQFWQQTKKTVQDPKLPGFD